MLRQLWGNPEFISPSPPRPPQYSVSLQSEEEIQQPYQRRPGQAVSVTGHGRHVEPCLHTASSHFALPVPLNITPGFSTDIGTHPRYHPAGVVVMAVVVVVVVRR